MKILIREDQFNRINSVIKKKIGPIDVIITQYDVNLLVRNNKIKLKKPHQKNKPINKEDNFIGYLCEKTKNHTNTPYCKLYDYSKKKKDKELISLNESVEILSNFFTWKKSGVLPKIINLALVSTNPVQYLETISDFINNDNFNKDETKKRLLNLTKLIKSGVTISDDDLETVLTSARNKVYQEYENSFVGEVFSKNPTLLKLNYKDSETNKNSFFQLVKQIQDDGANEKKIAEDIKIYIDASVKKFKEDPEKMKADVKTNVPLVLSGGSEIFGANTYFEIKKFGPNVDSHLSEFFAIFKDSKIIPEKPKYIKTYDNLIKTLYNEVKGKHSEFLDDIKSKIGGIILDNYIIIKIEDVDLYWSFLGQRKYENRLSIRYQLKSGNITGYECNPSNNILKEVPIKPKSNERIGVII